jgi:hypothetical protein
MLANPSFHSNTRGPWFGARGVRKCVIFDWPDLQGPSIATAGHSSAKQSPFGISCLEGCFLVLGHAHFAFFQDVSMYGQIDEKSAESLVVEVQGSEVIRLRRTIASVINTRTSSWVETGTSLLSCGPIEKHVRTAVGADIWRATSHGAPLGAFVEHGKP